MSKLNAKFDADLLLYFLSNFECDSHTVHTLTQWCLLPTLTSTVKSSVFTHVHSRPLSLAAQLYPCRSNRTHYTDSAWTFSNRPHIFICVYVLESIHKRDHTVFVFICHISLSIMSSRSIHVVSNGKISFFAI